MIIESIAGEGFLGVGYVFPPEIFGFDEMLNDAANW